MTSLNIRLPAIAALRTASFGPCPSREMADFLYRDVEFGVVGERQQRAPELDSAHLVAGNGELDTHAGLMFVAG